MSLETEVQLITVAAKVLQGDGSKTTPVRKPVKLKGLAIDHKGFKLVLMI